MSSISILLPTYSRRSFLSTALRCIQNQSFQNWRLLVINDGGDNVCDIVHSFRDSRIEYHDRPREGKAGALNYGLSKVETKYIAYMDDDDEIFPDHLNILYKAAEGNNKEFVYSDTYVTILNVDGSIDSKFIENSEDVDFSAIKFVNKINHKQILHTKSLSDKVGLYDTRLQILIDYDYIRRMACFVRPFHVNCVTGNHILRKTSSQVGDFSSISGLWQKDLDACGTSLLAIFEKDPRSFAQLYMEYSKIAQYNFEFMVKEKDMLLERNQALQRSLSNVLNSRSWKLTAPLRWFAKKVRLAYGGR